MPITESILRTAASDPHRIALSGTDLTLTYQQLVDGSGILWKVLTDVLPRGSKQPVIAISLTSAAETARLAAQLTGFDAIHAVIDPRWPLEHRLHLMEHARIDLMITEDTRFVQELESRSLPGLCITIDKLKQHESQVQRSTQNLEDPLPFPTARDGDEAFLMLFSSGTTSAPKAFIKTRQQYRANVAISSAHLGPIAAVNTLAPGPISYSLTLYAMIECLACSGSVFLANRLDLFTLGTRIRSENISRVVSVPATVHAITVAAGRDTASFSGLSLLVTGGANLPESIREAVKRTLPHACLISYNGAAEIGFIGDSRSGDGTYISIYEEITVEIRDENGDQLPDGELGTVWALSPAASEEYVTGTSQSSLRDKNGWASVHDRGRIMNGKLQLVGRAGDIIVTGGHKVALPEVERAFDAVPGIGPVCAIPLPHPTRGATIALVLEKNDEPLPQMQELASWARTHLAPQFIPTHWFTVNRLPRTVGGKIRREATTELVLAEKAAAL